MSWSQAWLELKNSRLANPDATRTGVLKTVARRNVNEIKRGYENIYFFWILRFEISKESVANMVVDKLIDRKVVVLTAQQATPLLLTGSSLRAIVCPTRQSIRSNKISGIMGCYRNGHCLRIFFHKYISTWCLKIYLFSTDFWKTAGFRCLIIIDLYLEFYQTS